MANEPSSLSVVVTSRRSDHHHGRRHRHHHSNATINNVHICGNEIENSTTSMMSVRVRSLFEICIICVLSTNQTRHLAIVRLSFTGHNKHLVRDKRPLLADVRRGGGKGVKKRMIVTQSFILGIVNANAAAVTDAKCQADRRIVEMS